MSSRKAPAYRQAGVDLAAAEEVVRRLKPLAAKTATPGVASHLGGFGGCFAFPDPRGKDLLVASIDGVGTKMKVTRLTGAWRSAGYDIVAHCVDDILTQGARPLFFLDYIGTSRLEVAEVEELALGMVEACREAECALLGGETAEMPGVYLAGETDLVGCIIGTVSRDRLLPGDRVGPGDRLIGLASLGLHTNGYSLARRILIDEGLGIDGLLAPAGPTIGEALAARHRMYWAGVRDLLDQPELHAMAHITGGGIPGNLVRVLPAGCQARVETGQWEIPPLFREIESRGGVARGEMFSVFNMGIGWILVVAAGVAERWAERLAAAGWGGWLIGEVAPGGGGVQLVP
ncbi:MAG: phosphoribosylformylglycinamidine cyclo-ligase [Candidatus Eisenbacteria sp.]|nr:phosphoribosylformylglycinamidine cyclo-ligase [Candidatus Eisenbacteria bacterium]